KLDVLDHLAEIQVCTAYSFEGRTLDELPSDPEVFERCQPVYETLPGWSTPTTGVRGFKALPEAARAYVERLSAAICCEVGILSTGPDRLDTVFRASSRIASWFE